MDMIGKIRRLHRRDHLSEREIARKARLSRNTVRKWLHGEVPEPPKYQRRAQPRKLDGIFDATKSHSVADTVRQAIVMALTPRAAPAWPCRCLGVAPRSRAVWPSGSARFLHARRGAYDER